MLTKEISIRKQKSVESEKQGKKNNLKQVDATSMTSFAGMNAKPHFSCNKSREKKKTSTTTAHHGSTILSKGRAAVPSRLHLPLCQHSRSIAPETRPLLPPFRNGQ
jgi:hypothetical protein